MLKKKTHGAYCIGCNMRLIPWLSVKKYGYKEEDEDEKMKIRPHKESDHDETKKAFDILIKTGKDHPEIEATLWVGALWSLLVTIYEKSGMPYDLFCKELEKIKECYKDWFEDEGEDE